MTPVRHYFEALNTVDHRTPIPATGLYVHRLLSKFNRLQLASVARYLWDNVGLVFYATDLVANYSTPMIPRAATLDRKWNEAANAFFDDWTQRADFSGRFDFWDLQRLGSFYLDTDGEVFALWTDEAGFPQIQVLESWRIDKPTAADDRIFDGVQLDTQGRVLGFWLDGETLLESNVLVQLYDLERYSQYRGMSPIRRGSNDMRDGNDIKGFQKVLSKLSTVLTLAIQGAPLEENPWGNPPEPAGEGSAEEETPAESNEKQRGFTVADLVAGDIPTVPDGHELKQVNTPSAPANNIEVMSYLAGCFVAGLGLPPAFFLDEKLTGPNQRAVNGKAQRKFDRRKQVIARLGRSAWQRVIGSGIASGALGSIDGWARCDFIGPSKITIDAGREMAQEREDVSRGLMTRRDHYGNRGRSWRRETDQVFDEIDYILDRAKEIADEHGIPIGAVMASFGIASGASAKAGEEQKRSNVPDSGNNDERNNADGVSDTQIGEIQVIDHLAPFGMALRLFLVPDEMSVRMEPAVIHGCLETGGRRQRLVQEHAGLFRRRDAGAAGHDTALTPERRRCQKHCGSQGQHQGAGTSHPLAQERRRLRTRAFARPGRWQPDGAQALGMRTTSTWACDSSMDVWLKRSEDLGTPGRHQLFIAWQNANKSKVVLVPATTSSG